MTHECPAIRETRPAREPGRALLGLLLAAAIGTTAITVTSVQLAFTPGPPARLA